MSRASASFPHPLYDKYVLKPFYEDAKKYYYGPMLAANRAHVVMLCRCDIITRENAAALLDALSQVEALGVDELTYRSGVEDLFFAMEGRLIELAGSAHGGNLQLARSRNDLGYALTRLALRPILLTVSKDLLSLRESLLAFGRAHLETLMPGYTIRSRRSRQQWRITSPACWPSCSAIQLVCNSPGTRTIRVRLARLP